MPTLYIDPEDETIRSETLENNDILAVAKVAFCNKIVQVWSYDAEVHYGTLPHPASDEACIALKQSYLRGMDAGIAVGRAQLQRELKAMLGVGQ